jgi:membrane-anchored glycerophosphoryl diester phosphodiesterase (GDPDase)
MRRSKPELTDWINYLISQRNIGFAVVIMFMSIFVVIFGLIITYENQIQSELINGLYALEFLIIVLFFYVVLFKLLKATKLLKNIMKGEILDPEKIREKWFKEK